MTETKLSEFSDRTETQIRNPSFSPLIESRNWPIKTGVDMEDQTKQTRCTHSDGKVGVKG